jgi:hypothetical protein
MSNYRTRSVCRASGLVQIANSLTEQCGHNFRFLGFWADYGQSGINRANCYANFGSRSTGLFPSCRPSTRNTNQWLLDECIVLLPSIEGYLRFGGDPDAIGRSPNRTCRRERLGYCSFVYSALARFRIGTSVSASSRVRGNSGTPPSLWPRRPRARSRAPSPDRKASSTVPNSGGPR